MGREPMEGREDEMDERRGRLMGRREMRRRSTIL